MPKVGADTDTASEVPSLIVKKLSDEGWTIEKDTNKVRCRTSEVKVKSGPPENFHKHRDLECVEI